MADFEYSLRLILDQEVRRCHLLKYKFIDSKDNIVSKFLENPEIKKAWNQKKSFFEFKSYILCILYSKYAILKDSPLFDNWLYEMYKSTLSGLLAKHGTGKTIDKDLKPSPYTVAFKASEILFSEIFYFEKENYNDYLISEFIEDNLKQACLNHYPIELGRLMKQLKIKDADFWMVIWHIIKKIAKRSVAYSIETRNGVLLLDKAQEETDWVEKITEEAHKVLLRKISNDELLNISNADRLWHYIRTVTINAIKSEYKDFDLFFDINQPFDDSLETALNIPIIDSDNADSITKALTGIIYNEKPGIYEVLTKGVNKEGLAMIKYVSNGYSYEEYIEDILGVPPATEKYKKEYQRLRKVLERTRDMLKDRLKNYYMN